MTHHTASTRVHCKCDECASLRLDASKDKAFAEGFRAGWNAALGRNPGRITHTSIASAWSKASSMLAALRRGHVTGDVQ